MSGRVVLVTGSAGVIGQAVTGALLRRGHTVRALDRLPTPTPEGADGSRLTSIVGETSDAAAVDEATAGVDAVVHLAATVDRAPFVEELVGPNVVGPMRVLDAARRMGVGRVVLASSIQAIGGLIRDHGVWGVRPVGVDESAPRNHYALTKRWTEQMGELYARQGWVPSVIAARIGWLPRTVEHERDMHEHPRGRVEYLSRGDAGRFFAAAVEAGHAGFDVLYAMGPAAEGCVDLKRGVRLIGYEPRDVWPSGAVAEARWRSDA